MRLFVMALLVSVAEVLAASERPNIVWISCEDTSPDLGCYGDAYAHTPHLDGFAAQGARFTNAFTVAGVCAPSRSAIITGMYPSSIGTHHMRSKGVPPAFVKCFPEYLRAAGYYCTNNAKTDYNFDSPLTAWDECSPRAHWRNRKPGQPFFAVFNIMTTHESRIRAPEVDFLRLTRLLTLDDRHDPLKAVLPPYYPDTPIVRNDWARYYDLVTAMDLEAANLLKQLDNEGLAANTVVFFWGDHGRGLPRAKRWVYDSGIHVPLLVRWPGRIAPGSVRDDLVSLLDLGPTVLSVAGVPIPTHVQGRPFLGPGATKRREYIFAARDRMDETYDIIRCVRDARYKLIRNFEPEKPYAQSIAYAELMPTLREMRGLNAEGKLAGPVSLFFAAHKPREELYDLQSDPHEIRNLIDTPGLGDIRDRLRVVLENWMEEIHDLGLVSEPELQERTRPGGKWGTTAAPQIRWSVDETSSRTNQGPAHSTAGSERLVVNLTSSTRGASIAYALEAGGTASGSPATGVRQRGSTGWLLYAGPFMVSPGAVVRAKGCRLGYLDSPESRAVVRVGGSAPALNRGTQPVREGAAR